MPKKKSAKKADQPELPLDTAPAEPSLSCLECGRPLWCYHDFASGQDEYYCPTCTVFEPVGA